MAAKMSPKDAIQKFGVRLHKELPLDDPIFLGMVDGAGFLVLNYRASIEVKATRAEKVAFFQQKVLEPRPDIYLPKLLDVMDDSGDIAAKSLAKDIREVTEL